MNEIIEMPRREAAGLAAGEMHRFSAVEIRQRVNLVQEVMQGIMKRDTHYGTIPGTPKPTLYKPGAEVLCVTFRVAQTYRIEDLSTPDIARYRVTCIGTHQTTGIVLGEGLGECSSGEEKYKWRSAVCLEEFETTPENLRRVKFGKKSGGFYKANQVRTEAADLSNTVLKMACKRAMIAMTLNVTAASDIFTQDIEDLPEELRHDDEPPSEPSAHGKSEARSQRPQPSEALLKEARDAANKGVAVYSKFWTETTKENRQMLAGEHEAMKAIAIGSDAKPAEASIESREPCADDELEADFKRQLAAELGGEQ